MTIIEAKEFLNSLLLESIKKSEVKTYQKFIGVLIGLENRNLSTTKIELIEQQLTKLDLRQASKNRLKLIRKKYNEFVKYLHTEFSLVLKDHFTTYGISLGMVFGLAIGTAVFRDSGGGTTGMCIGMILGYLVGQYMEKEALKKDQVLIIA